MTNQEVLYVIPPEEPFGPQTPITEEDLLALRRYKQSQSEKGKKGGKSRSERKVRAVRENLKLAHQARLHRGERRERPTEAGEGVPNQAVSEV